MAPSRKPDVIGRAPSNRDFDKIARLKSNEWTTIVPMMELQPGYEKTRYTFIHNNDFLDKYTHVRLNLHPDGGIARFRVYGDIELELPAEGNGNTVMDMVNMQNGGRCLAYCMYTPYIIQLVLIDVLKFIISFFQLMHTLVIQRI